MVRRTKGALSMFAVLTTDEIRHLPPVLTVVQAAALLGIGRSNAYHAVKTQTWPTRVVHIGRCIRIPTAEVLRLLGIETSGEDS
jgi:predicted DNA-binding transcriptional regulator AlpA